MRVNLEYESSIQCETFYIHSHVNEFSILRNCCTIKICSILKIAWKGWKRIVPVQRKIIMVYKTLARVSSFPHFS